MAQVPFAAFVRNASIVGVLCIVSGLAMYFWHKKLNSPLVDSDWFTAIFVMLMTVYGSVLVWIPMAIKAFLKHEPSLKDVLWRNYSPIVWAATFCSLTAFSFNRKI